MKHNTWGKDRDLLAEAYNQYVYEEGIFDYFKGFSRKLFNKTENKYEGFDDQLIEDLTDRLRAGGPEAVLSFLDTIKAEAGSEFEGVVSSNASKILKALRYSIDTAVDGVGNMIYDLVDGMKEDFDRAGRRFDPETGDRIKRFNSNEEENNESSPRVILANLEKHIQNTKLNKSFGFNAETSLQMVDHMINLSNKLKSSLTKDLTEDPEAV